MFNMLIADFPAVFFLFGYETQQAVATPYVRQ